MAPLGLFVQADHVSYRKKFHDCAPWRCAASVRLVARNTREPIHSGLSPMTHAELALSSTLAVPSHVLARQAAGETVLMNLDNEQYYSLDGPGNRLWELLGQEVSFGSAVETLLDEYEVERDVLVGDMRDLLNDLLQNGLVVIANGAGRG
jgi:hypothetical protein